MSRSVGSFRRSGPQFKPQPRILVICEDSKSGKTYLKDASRHFRVDVDVDITHCSHTDPLGIVRVALKRSTSYDHVYCAIDRDDHKNFDEALAFAKDLGKITLIVSYPCFEFWLMLHFGYCRKPYTATGGASSADRLIADLRKLKGMEAYSKGKDENLFEAMFSRYPDAKITAERVLSEAIDTNEMNPSTQLQNLLLIFEQLAVPRPL